MSGPDLAFDLAASGMAAQRIELNVIAQNLANAGTLRGENGGPYRARVPVFESASPFSLELARANDDFAIDFPADDDAGIRPRGVRLASIVERTAAQSYRFDPQNPLAQVAGPHKGFVAVPDVDPIEEMVELIAAGRAYDADVAVLQNAKQMEVEAADIARL